MDKNTNTKNATEFHSLKLSKGAAAYKYLLIRPSESPPNGEKEALVVCNYESYIVKHVLIRRADLGFHVLFEHDYVPGSKSGTRMVIYGEGEFKIDHVGKDSSALKVCGAMVREMLSPFGTLYDSLINHLSKDWVEYAAKALEKIRATAPSLPEPYASVFSKYLTLP